MDMVVKIIIYSRDYSKIKTLQAKISVRFKQGTKKEEMKTSNSN